MNSNSLFQSIQVLEGQIADYNHLLQSLNKKQAKADSEQEATESDENQR